MSTALISGLVLCGPAANAEVVTDEANSSPAESSASVDSPTEPVVVTVAPESPVEEVIESEAAVVPTESQATPDVEEPVETATSEPAISPTPEPSETQTGQPDEAAKSEPMVAESSSAPEPEATTEVTAEASESAESTSTPTDVADQDEDPRWAQIDALMPEGSEDWDEAQWEAFEQTEAGQEMNRLLDELFAEDDIWDEESELSDEELAFWESITDLLPEESFDWDEAQWEAYLSTDQGLELLDLMLPFIAESIESDEDATEFQAFLEEVFAHNPELRAYYLELFFGIQPEQEDDDIDEPQTDQEMVPSESESASASAEIEPAGDVSAAPSAKKQDTKKSADSATPVLANTGFDGVTAGVAGLLVALAGAVFVALGRRKSTKH